MDRLSISNFSSSGMNSGSTFPAGFVWGAASASYQIEGGVQEHGRGDSVWDVFCRQPGLVVNGHTGERSCDHVRRYAEDVALMREMNLAAYRFSIAWPRVMPEGRGTVSEAGLGFYDRLVDELLAKGVTPWVTLFHWDFPQALFHAGGWLNRDSASWFAEYAAVVVDRLSDRVHHWITLNEPQIYIGLGHYDTKHAPGIKYPFSQALLASHHTLLAHGRAAQVIRARAKTKPTVGWAPVGKVDVPATESAADIDAARRSTMKGTDRHFFTNTWFGDPVILGRYPEDALAAFGKDAPVPHAGDMETIAQPLDFYGLNIYSGGRVKAGSDGSGVTSVDHGVGHARNALNWPIVPESLRWGPRFIHERYGLPVVITENGMTNLDWVHADGRVHDPQRIDFTRRYLLELRKAIDDGADIRGYFHWSVMDNFEWAEGYKDRFGLIHVDYQTLRRTIKESGRWYAQVIASNGANLSPAPGPVEPKPLAVRA